MVVGDLVRFKFNFELDSGKFIKSGDLGIIESKALWYSHVLHIGSGEYILLEKNNIEKLEI